MYGTQAFKCSRHNFFKFENDVKMYSTQARTHHEKAEEGFENDVKMYGTQAGSPKQIAWAKFENDVKTYGTQAYCFEFMVLHGIANGVIVLTRLFPVDLTGNIDIFRWEKGQYRNITQCIALFGRVYQMAKSIRIRV